MTVTDWLARMTLDAESRGLSGLVPLLQALARSTEALRAADGEFGHSATEQATDQGVSTERTPADATEHANRHASR